MKTSRKSVLVVALLLCIAGGSLAAYGMFWATSNVVHVDMQYTVALSFSVSSSDVTLIAAVTNNGNPVGSGISVDFYYSVNGGVDWLYLVTRTTNVNGVAQTIYTVTANGGYDFKAIAIIP